MAVVAAQTPPPATSGASSTTGPQTITVTGCVTPDTMASPSTGSPRFVLSSIEPQGSARSRSTVTGYTLTPSADVNLGDAPEPQGADHGHGRHGDDVQPDVDAAVLAEHVERDARVARDVGEDGVLDLPIAIDCRGGSGRAN